MIATYEVGQAVFSEGEESDFVGFIVDGEAEVTKRHADTVITIGRLAAGEFFGEMAAIEGRQHSATVRATGSLTIDRLAKPDFLERVSRDSDLALRLLQRLSHRLYTMDDAYAAAVATNRDMAKRLKSATTEPVSDVGSDASSIKLLPGSDFVTASLPADGLILRHLPFVIGRTPSNLERAPRDPVDLCLNDPAPYRLSRSHFSISRQNGRAVVRDLNSHLGTSVNGSFIGRFFTRDTAELRPGENVIVAGGEDSPYVFRVVLTG